MSRPEKSATQLNPPATAIHVRLCLLPTVHHATPPISSVSIRIYLEAPGNVILYDEMHESCIARCQCRVQNGYLIVDKTDNLPPSRIHLR